MKLDYNYKECHYHIQDNTKRLRCPKCKNHGEDIATRGDCKNIIIMENGHLAQCMCYSKEHK